MSNDNIKTANTFNASPSSGFSSYAAAYAALELCVSRLDRAGPGDVEEMENVIREAGYALAFCRTRIRDLRDACGRTLADLS